MRLHKIRGWTRQDGLRRLREGAWDRLSDSDPGLFRLDGATVAVGGVLLTLLVLGTSGAPVTVLVIASWSSMVAGYAVGDRKPRAQAVTLLIATPVSILALAVGTALAPYRVAADTVLVAFVFSAIYARRYGHRGGALGEFASQHFFMAQFIHATLAEIPSACLFVVVAVGCSAFVRLGLVRATPRRVLGRLQWAFCARLRATADAMIDLASAEPGSPAAARRTLALHGASARLHQAALLIQSWAETGVDDQGTAALVRRRVAEAEIAVERLALGLLKAVSPEHDSSSGRALRVHLLTWADGRRKRISPSGEQLDPAVERLRRELQCLRRLILRPAAVASGPVEEAARKRLLGYGKDTELPEHCRRDLREAYLALGALARAMVGLRLALAVTHDDPDEDAVPAIVGADSEAESNAPQAKEADRVEPTGLKRPTTRSAVQAAFGSGIAIVGGEIVSPEHWYWAMITCWVVFINTSSIGEVLVKGYRRLAGTIVGLAAGTGLVAVVAGDASMAFALTMICMFGTFLTASVSYLLMSMLATTMVGLSYAMLGTYSDSILLLRVEETALGAAAGLIAALVVMPARSGHRADEQLARVLQSMRKVISLAFARLGGRVRTDVLGAARELDAALDAFRVLVQPSVHPASPLRGRRNRSRCILGVLETCAYHARALAVIVEAVPCNPPFFDADGLAQAREQLDENLAVLADCAESSRQGSRTCPPLPWPAWAARFRFPDGSHSDSLLSSQILGHLQRIDANILALARPLGLADLASEDGGMDDRARPPAIS